VFRKVEVQCMRINRLEEYRVLGCVAASKEDGADWDGGVGDSAAECGDGGG
jgi:hypothetical protein